MYMLNGCIYLNMCPVLIETLYNYLFLFDVEKKKSCELIIESKNIYSHNNTVNFDIFEGKTRASCSRAPVICNHGYVLQTK